MKLPLHPLMSNEELSNVFAFIGQIIGMEEGNRFRARAYDEASVIIRQLPYELKNRFEDLHQELPGAAAETFKQQLDELPGIGDAISSKLTELFTTGNIAAFQKYAERVPGGMYSLMQIHGIGAKKAYNLAMQFDLDSPETAVSELLTKAKHGAIRGLTGFGEKSEQSLIESLEAQHKKARIPYDQALEVAQRVKNALQNSKAIKEVAFLGSLRRESATVGDIDIGLATNDPKAVVEELNQLPFVKRVLASGESFVSIVVEPGWQVDMKLSAPEDWGSFIQHFTGSKQHNIQMRERALKIGYSLSEHGVKLRDSGELKHFADEKSFYNFLGLEVVPPNERIGKDELERYRLSSSIN